jgi:hypothetical protein
MDDLGQYDWLLTHPLHATIEADEAGKAIFRFKDAEPGSHQEAVLSYRNGRLLFDGVDIETELFIAFISLLDEVEETAIDDKAEIPADPDYRLDPS